MTITGTKETFHRLLEVLSLSGVLHLIHEHRETRTIYDAARNLSFQVAGVIPARLNSLCQYFPNENETARMYKTCLASPPIIADTASNIHVRGVLK